VGSWAWTSVVWNPAFVGVGVDPAVADEFLKPEFQYTTSVNTRVRGTALYLPRTCCACWAALVCTSDKVLFVRAQRASMRPTFGILHCLLVGYEDLCGARVITLQVVLCTVLASSMRP
jgi:hypothetical protein